MSAGLTSTMLLTCIQPHVLQMGNRAAATAAKGEGMTGERCRC